MKKAHFTAAKIAALGLLTALSLIAFIIESLIPVIIIPGAKLGISNAFSFAALIMYSPVEAFLIVIARTVLGALFAGNFSALMYSFTGGVVAMGVSSLLIYAVPKISVIGASIAAACAHNVTQNIVFAIVSQTPLALTYMPYLILLGIASGAAVGAVIYLIIKRVPVTAFGKIISR